MCVCVCRQVFSTQRARPHSLNWSRARLGNAEGFADGFNEGFADSFADGVADSFADGDGDVRMRSVAPRRAATAGRRRRRARCAPQPRRRARVHQPHPRESFISMICRCVPVVLVLCYGGGEIAAWRPRIRHTRLERTTKASVVMSAFYNVNCSGSNRQIGGTVPILRG